MTQGSKCPNSTVFIALAVLMNKEVGEPTFLCFATVETSGNTFKETS